MPNTDDQQTLEHRLRKWREDHGYPLEQQTGHAFAQVGFEVAFSQHYDDEDQNSGQPRRREIDVVATLARTIPAHHPAVGGLGIEVTVSFYVECKRTPGKPWMVLTSELNPHPAPGVLVRSLASQLGEYAVRWLDHAEGCDENSLFGQPERPGHAVVVAFRQDPDMPDSATAALHAATTAALRLRREEEVPRFPRVCHLGFPLVVTDSRLFASWTDAAADEDPLEERQQVRLYWQGNRWLEAPVSVDIVTRAGLDQYTRELRAGCEALLSRFQENFTQWLAHLQPESPNDLGVWLTFIRAGHWSGPSR